MKKLTDAAVCEVEISFRACRLRWPYRIGNIVIEDFPIAMAKVAVELGDGRRATGYGSTPLSVGWAWPDAGLDWREREKRMCNACVSLADAWRQVSVAGHPLELGFDFLEQRLAAAVPGLPELAALVCNSPFDLALHDAYGRALGVSSFATCRPSFLSRDLADFFCDDALCMTYPERYLVAAPPARLPVWHSVGGLDALTEAELTGSEPADGYPVTLEEWIRRDGLDCLKFKLVGNNFDWDVKRTLGIGELARKYGVHHLSPDFNCTATGVDYVNSVLDEVKGQDAEAYRRIDYVEQPFGHDFIERGVDVSSIAARKPLYLDESAHDWRCVERGRRLGWTGVALKVCKTLTGALLSGCYARTRGMGIMVQDLTNPAEAMIPHVNFAARIGSTLGVECNSPQFCPAASQEFEARHPGLYRRRGGVVELGTLRQLGLGYLPEDIAEIAAAMGGADR